MARIGVKEARVAMKATKEECFPILPIQLHCSPARVTKCRLRMGFKIL